VCSSADSHIDSLNMKRIFLIVIWLIVVVCGLQPSDQKCRNCIWNKGVFLQHIDGEWSCSRKEVIDKEGTYKLM
jgi:hypothetical protein